MAKTKKKIAKKTPVKSKKASTKKSSAKKPTATKKKTAKKASKKVVKKVAAKKPAAKLAPPKLATPKLLGSAALLKALSPLDDRLVIQVEVQEKVTAGGLFIPATVSDVSGNLKGRVLAVGRGHMNKKGHVKPMDVKVGDTVMVSEYAGTKYEFQGVDLLIIRESDVLGIVEK